MSSISPRSSKSSLRPPSNRKPKWRSSQFLTTSGQPATGVSKVFAQPLQGSPLRSAIDGLPSVTSLDDNGSIFSVDEMRKKRERVVEVAVEDPQLRGADPSQEAEVASKEGGDNDTAKDDAGECYRIIYCHQLFNA